jgi:hypothetical protein
MAFGGISRSIRYQTLHVRWRSIAVIGRKQMLAFAALVAAKPGAIWPVENMYLTDTSHLRWVFNQDEWAPPNSLHKLGQKFKIKAARVSLKAKADAAVIGALTAILATVSSSLRRMSLCMLAFPRCIFQPAPLPCLESLTCFLDHGFPRPLYHPAYKIMLASPVFNRLHIIPYSVHSMESFFSHLEELVLPTLAVINLSVASVHLTNERANVVLTRSIASLVNTSLHIAILPDQHVCCCCQVHDIYEGVQTASITVSAIKSRIKSKPAARVTIRDPGGVLSCADRTRKTQSDPFKQVVWDDWVYRLDGKTWIGRMADDNLQEWRLGASGILDEPFVGDREELF